MARWPVPLLVLAWGCAGVGRLQAPPAPIAACWDGSGLPGDALNACAPEIHQETVSGPGAAWDRPTLLDFDGSGSLADDAVHAKVRPPDGDVRPYTSWRAAGRRLFFTYLLYYPADWSGSPAHPRLDHAGDLEGALVVLDVAQGRVSAVVTQAHGRLHLWTPAGEPSPPSASGTFATGADGRPLLFAEAGGHGLYALGDGDWRPRGGPHYPRGTRSVASRPLPWPSDASSRSAEELRRWSRPGGLVGLPHGALPPWEWRDRKGRAGERGLIMDDPARLLELLMSAGPP